ncbi:MAG: SpoIIE family protein phosphatase [Deltaproteobacteria bacterium]|jgi:sigma-B regulation protein RsbU (phosphoserine phosphatase)|nr:SpoIIE family protein phosphatase [Deltaproteobacteria bacterium]
MTIDKKNMITDDSSDLQACITRVERLSNCIKISNLINSELSIGKLLSKLMETTKKTLVADAVSMLLIDDKTKDLTFHISIGEAGEEIKEIYNLKKGQGIAGFVAETGLPLNIEDAYHHSKFAPEIDRKTNYHTKAMLCVPLKIRGEVIGVIEVINKMIKPFFFSAEELEMLITISSSAAVAIDTAKMHQIILKRKTLERDVKLAKEVQSSFLPQELPLIENYKFAVLNQPALEIGGDFYNFFKLPANKLGIVLGDVSGKGISASLFMARLTSDLQYYTLLYPDPKELLTQMNKVLCERTKRGMFVTLLYILLDTKENRLRIANAGHISPIYSSNEGTRLLCDDDKKGPPLGIIHEIEYVQEIFELGDDSCVTIFTDGIIEAKNYNSELFGIKRLLREIENNPNDPDLMIKKITSKIDNFTLTQDRSDDLTLLVFSLNNEKKIKPVCLSIKSHPENLRQIRNLINKTLLKTKLSKQNSQNIILAVVEACSNIIKHGYKNDYNQKIDLTVNVEANILTISIIDKGLKFDINSFEPRDVSKVKPGGLGVHIIKQVMDTVEYTQTSQGFNKIKMVKKLLS